MEVVSSLSLDHSAPRQNTSRQRYHHKQHHRDEQCIPRNAHSTRSEEQHDEGSERDEDDQVVGRNLHDGVGQMMSGVKINLSVFQDNLHNLPEEELLQFDNILGLVDESCKEVRAISHNMMPNALLKAGLSSAVHDFLNKIDSKVLEVNLYTEGLNERLNTGIETVLYRVIQECVNNTIKHAEAKRLDISIIKDEEGISATIEDNGKGFDTTTTDIFEGIGLKNIRTRVQYLKGTVDFDSAIGRGTVVTIQIPYT